MNEGEPNNGASNSILEFDKVGFIRGMESAGLQLADRQGAPLEKIQANIEWAQKLPDDAIIKYDASTGRVYRDLGSTGVEIE